MSIPQLGPIVSVTVDLPVPLTAGQLAYCVDQVRQLSVTDLTTFRLYQFWDDEMYAFFGMAGYTPGQNLRVIPSTGHGNNRGFQLATTRQYLRVTIEDFEWNPSDPIVTDGLGGLPLGTQNRSIIFPIREFADHLTDFIEKMAAQLPHPHDDACINLIRLLE